MVRKMNSVASYIRYEFSKIMGREVLCSYGIFASLK